MKKVLPRIGLVLVLALGMTLVMGGPVRADLTVTSFTQDNTRGGNVIETDPGASYGPTDGNGSDSASDGPASGSSSNALTFTETPTLLSIQTSASSSGSGDENSAVNTFGLARRWDIFQVDAGGTYDVSGTVIVTGTFHGNSPLDYSGEIYLKDLTNGTTIFDYSYALEVDSILQSGSIPLQVTLSAGIQYELFASSSAQSITSDQTVDGTTGAAEADVALSLANSETIATPEPATLAGAATGVLMIAGLAWRRKRAA